MVSSAFTSSSGNRPISKADAKREKLLLQVLRKIPIFTELSPTQLKTVLRLCVHRQCLPGDILCASGTPSDEMYILLSGEIAIVTPDNSTQPGLRLPL